MEQQTTEMTKQERKAKEKAEKQQKKEEEKARKKAEKARKKAEKEPYNWEKERPKLSGAVSMDAYILYCDTMWNRIQDYRESMTFFRLDTVPARTETDEIIYVVKILDEDGNQKNFGRSLLQGMEMALTGTNIILDVAVISLMTTNASLDLAANPLLVFSHTKCLKGGPQIISLAYNEVKEIVNATKSQMADIKSMKSSCLEGSTDMAYLIPMDDKELPDDIEILDLVDIDLGDVGLDETDVSELDNFDFDMIEVTEEE